MPDEEGVQKARREEARTAAPDYTPVGNHNRLGTAQPGRLWMADLPGRLVLNNAEGVAQ